DNLEPVLVLTPLVLQRDELFEQLAEGGRSLGCVLLGLGQLVNCASVVGRFDNATRSAVIEHVAKVGNFYFVPFAAQVFSKQSFVSLADAFLVRVVHVVLLPELLS